MAFGDKTYPGLVRLPVENWLCRWEMKIGGNREPAEGAAKRVRREDGWTMQGPSGCASAHPEGEGKTTLQIATGSWPMDTPGGRFHAE